MLNKDQSKPRGLISSLKEANRNDTTSVPSSCLSSTYTEEKLIKVHQELP